MDPRQACLDCLAQEPPALFEAALWIAAEHLPAYSPPTPCASSTNSSGRSAPAWTTAPRPASAAPGVAARMSEQGFCRRRRLPPATALGLLPLGAGSGARDSRCRWRWWPSELARPLDIPLVGVNFPGRFLLRVPQADHLLDPATGRRPLSHRLPRTAAAPAGAEERAASRLPEAGSPGEILQRLSRQPATTAQRRRRAAGRAEGCPAGDRTRPGGRPADHEARAGLYRQLDCPQAERYDLEARALAQASIPPSNCASASAWANSPRDRPRPALRPLRRAGEALARATAWVRRAPRALPLMRRAWVFTVCREMNSCSPISWLEQPWAIRPEHRQLPTN